MTPSTTSSQRADAEIGAPPVASAILVDIESGPQPGGTTVRCGEIVGGPNVSGTARPFPDGQRPDATGAAAAPPAVAPKPRRPRWLWLGLAGALLVALGLLFFFNPAQHSFYPFCTFHRLTGWQCPGCGGLRAVHHLLHGELGTALRFNPLFVVALPLVAWLLVRRWWRGSQAAPVPHRTQARWAWTILAVLIVFWIVRNLPVEFFRLPNE